METIKVFHKKQVFTNEIIFLKSNINYTELHFENGHKILLARTLKTIYQSLASHKFFRINRSNVINIKYLSKTMENYAIVKLSNDIELHVSRRRRSDLKDFIYAKEESK